MSSPRWTLRPRRQVTVSVHPEAYLKLCVTAKERKTTVTAMVREAVYKAIDVDLPTDMRPEKPGGAFNR